jgi:hypothetical protein
MTKYLSILVLSVLAASAAQAASLLAPGAQDQVPSRLAVQAKALPSTALDRTPVHVSHALDGTQALDVAPKAFVAQSREFWSEVGETELRAGVKVTTTAPGALIRLSPQGGSTAALDPAGVLVRANGRTLSANEASSAVADAKSLRSAGMVVTDGTLAFRLAAASGSGEVEIAAAHAQGRYLVHVFEPDSTLVLSLAADRDTTLAGSAITFRAALTDGNAARALRLASGLVTAPDGYSADLHFTRNGDGSFSATFTPDAAHSDGPQLWEAHAFTATMAGALTVLRDAKTAFAVSEASARFGGDASITRDASGLRVALGVTTANASRYQVSAVLYGTGADGALRPAALAQSATWLAASGGTVELGFDAETLGMLRAPFELRDLRLVDQANMGVIERRERALLIDN